MEDNTEWPNVASHQAQTFKAECDVKVNGEDQVAATQMSLTETTTRKIVDMDTTLVEWSFREVGKGCLASS